MMEFVLIAPPSQRDLTGLITSSDACGHNIAVSPFEQLERHLLIQAITEHCRAQRIAADLLVEYGIEQRARWTKL